MNLGDTMKTLNYGIISAATIVPRFVAGLNETTHSRAIAIGASTLEKAKNLADKLNIPKAYGSYLQVYEDEDVDVVYIANINDQHYPQIMLALKHNKHVVCEKPLALTPEHVKNAFAFAKKQGLFLMEAQKTVFLPTSQFIKDKILDKEFGELRQVTLNASWLIDFPKSHWIYDQHQAGVLFSSASYIVEYLLYLLDNPNFEYKALVHVGSKNEIDDAAILFKFDDKLLVSSQLSMIVKTNNEANFYFDKAKITVKKFWSANQLEILNYKDNQIETVVFNKVPEMFYEIEHIYECISNKQIQSLKMSENITLTCVTLVDEIYQTTQQ